MTTQGLTYAKAGVSIEAGDKLVRRIGPIAGKTRIPGVIAGVGGFSALVRSSEPWLSSSHFGFVHRRRRHEAKDCFHDRHSRHRRHRSGGDGRERYFDSRRGAAFFLDYFVCGKLDVDIAEAVVRGIAAGCRQAGCALIGGETAEHPGDFPKGEYDLAGFVVGVLEKKKMIDPAKIVAGDMLIGLPSSGLHSNGYSLARKVLLEKGRMKLHRRIPDLGRTLAEELLEPTRIYAKITGKLFDEIPDQRRGAYHRRRHHGKFAANITERPARGHRTSELAGAAGLQAHSKDRRRCPRRNGPHFQQWTGHDPDRRQKTGRCRDAHDRGHRRKMFYDRRNP